MNTKIKRICIDCGERVKNRSKKTLRCRRCYVKNKKIKARGRFTNNCIICGTKLSTIKNKTSKCIDCYFDSKIPWNKGVKGLIPWNKGKSGLQTAWNKGKGTKTPLYKRLRNSKEYITWRNIVFRRDNYICQKCRIPGRRIHPHHIRSFIKNPKLRYEPLNGITLCEEHHKKFHKIYGKKCDLRIELLEFLTGN